MTAVLVLPPTPVIAVNAWAQRLPVVQKFTPITTTPFVPRVQAQKLWIPSPSPAEYSPVTWFTLVDDDDISIQQQSGDLDAPFLSAIWWYMLECVRDRDSRALEVCMLLAHLDPALPDQGGRFLHAALSVYPVDTLTFLDRLVSKAPTGLCLVPNQAFLVELVHRSIGDAVWLRLAVAAGWSKSGIPLTHATLIRLVDKTMDGHTIHWLMQRVPWPAACTTIVERLVTREKNPWLHFAALLCKQYRVLPSWPCVLVYLKAGRIFQLLAHSRASIVHTYYHQLLAYAMETNDRSLFPLLTTRLRLPNVTLAAHMPSCIHPVQ